MLLLLDLLVELLSISPGKLNGGGVGASVILDSSVGLGFGLGRRDEEINEVLPAMDSREVAAAGVGRDSVLDLELKYSEAAAASVVLILNVVQVVERLEVTIDAWISIEYVQ